MIEELRAIRIAPITVTPNANFSIQSPQSTVIIRRDCCVGTAISTRDSACSPIAFSETAEDSSEFGEHSGADGLELDDEGVYFAYDYPDRNSFPNDNDYEDIDDFELPGTSHHPYEEEEDESQQKSEQFSNLVSLIKGISNDLLQLESGYQELIQRVQMNRIQLDHVNDSLSYVWSCKDVEDGMGKSWCSSSAYSSNVLSNRYTPMGASFISTGTTGSCCVCDCHSPEKEPKYGLNQETDILYLPCKYRLYIGFVNQTAW